MITEKKQIANTFNHFFCNIPKQIEKGIIPTQKTYDDFLTNPIEQSFKFDLTSDKEIIMHIKALKNNKSNGPFNISNELFKRFKKPLSTPLTLLIDLTFTKGPFQMFWTWHSKDRKLIFYIRSKDELMKV